MHKQVKQVTSIEHWCTLHFTMFSGHFLLALYLSKFVEYFTADWETSSCERGKEEQLSAFSSSAAAEDDDQCTRLVDYVFQSSTS